MKKVFMVHGFNGQPNGGWRPWLMGQLAKKDIWACALSMPTPNKPEKEEWVKTILENVEIPNEEIFLVGHSLGVPAILHYLENLPAGTNIGGAVLVSGPVHTLSRYEIDDFMNMPFNFEHIKNVCKNFIIIHGNNDEAVPFSEGEFLSKNLSCNLISIPNGGHLSGSEGWHEFPELLNALNEMIK